MFFRNSLSARFSPFSIVSAFVIVVPSFLSLSTILGGILRETRRERQSKNSGAYFCLLFGSLLARICFSFGCECSSVGRASPCQGECRVFESLHSLHFLPGCGRFSSWLAGMFSLFPQTVSFFAIFLPKQNFCFPCCFWWEARCLFLFIGVKKSQKKAPSKLRKARRQRRFFGGFCSFGV